MRHLVPALGFSLAWVAALLAAAGSAVAAEEGYCAQPALHGDRMVFVSEGDLWTADVPAAGSTGPVVAHRLTSADGDEARPRISPDGKSLAFTGQYDGNLDVYVMPIDGGAPRRLTFHPEADVALGWTPDGKEVLYRTAAANPLARFELWRVPAAGGAPARFDFGECTMADVHPDGRRIAFTRWSNETWSWKRYRGGTAPDVWVGDLADGTFAKLTTSDANDLFPAWVGDEVVFLSDRTGTANLYADRAPGGEPRAITAFAPKPGDPLAVEGYDVRWPSRDARPGGTRIVFVQAGALALVDAKDGSVRRLDVRIASDRRQARDRFVDPTGTATELVFAGDGKTLLLGSRGEVMAVPIEKGPPARAVTRSSQAREWGVTPLGKDRLALITDASGEQAVATVPLDGSAAPTPVGPVAQEWIFPPEASHDGAWIAYADKTLHLHLVEVATKKTRVVAESEASEIRQYRFAPDGRWLAYVLPLPNGFGSVRLHEVATGATTVVSDALHDAGEPVWDPAGKYLYFLAKSHLDPILSDLDFEHAFTATTTVYAVPLQRETPPPFPAEARAAGFDLDAWAEAPPEDEDDGDAKEDDEPSKGKPSKDGPSKDGPSKDEKETPKKDGKKPEPKGKAKEEKEDGEDEDGPEPVEIDVEGISARAVRLPIAPGEISNLEATYGAVLWTTTPRRGLLVEDEEAVSVLQGGRDTVHRRNLAKEKDAETKLATAVDGYALSGDARRLAYGKGGTLHVIDALGDGEDADEVEVSDLRLHVRVRQEWGQILAEAWRLQRDFYWAPTYRGVDWPAMRKKYEALLPRVGTRAELNDLIGQMIGELGTSHTYVYGGPVLEAPAAVSVGLLGADLVRDGEGVRIAAVIPHQHWSDDLRSPLDAAHLGVKPGEFLLSIDGVPVGKDVDPYALLQDKADKPVRLEIGADASGKGRRAITVRTIASERNVRYAAWVEANRRVVEARSKGALGYVHVPDMGGPGLVSFGRYFYPQFTKKGLVVDIRDNGGGFVSQMIIRRLDRPVWAFMQPRHGTAYRYPEKALHGHLAVLIDQHAGSDGDIFPASFRLRKLGPLIGTRTWGGVVGIRSDKPFVDFGMSTQPEYAWWSPEDGWTIENRGVSPDVEIDVTPADRRAGKDPQLESAISYLLRKLVEDPKELPKHPDFPTR